MDQLIIRIKLNSERCSLFLFVLLIGLVGCQPQEPSKQQLVFSGPIMGTEYRITVIHQAKVDKVALEASILSAMNSVNQSMSNYLSDSELSVFNRIPAKQPQKLSADFAAVMAEALAISVISEGAFDVTLGKTIDAWGFGPDGRIEQRPKPEDLAQLRLTIGFDKLVLDDGFLTKTVAGVEISLSAIAKGYAVDKVALALDSQGFSDYLVNIGGELRASGRSIDNVLWRIGIEKPHILGGIQEVARLDNVSIATSGDYRNYLLIDGEQYSHMIDPQTLMPVYHKLALVSVISDRASTADALATAMMAMNETRAWVFAQKNQLAAYLVIRGEREGEYKIQATEKFRAYLK